MSESFFINPILNSPYEPPSQHHALDAEGQPLEQPPVAGRRQAEVADWIVARVKAREDGVGADDRRARALKAISASV